jgi:hypothetical protein
MVLGGTAGAVRPQLAMESEGVTVSIHRVRLVLGKAHEFYERDRTVLEREVPIADPYVVDHEEWNASITRSATTCVQVA